MTHPDQTIPHHIGELRGAEGDKIVADFYGSSGKPVLLLHGGGQTRHAWGGAARALARSGYLAVTIDQRGHGDSDWSHLAHYKYAHFAQDLTIISDQLAERTGNRPVIITASYAGLSTLLAVGRYRAAHGRDLVSALVIVDMSLTQDPEGTAKIRGFLRASPNGFATLDEAADAVAAYMPHRPRPSNTKGLQKNLRLHADGRWRWHWDPLFMDGPDAIDTDRDAIDAELRATSASLHFPVMLVRGGSSELIMEDHARDFLNLATHAEYVDVAGARHMLVGDANDQFTTCVVEFLGRVHSND